MSNDKMKPGTVAGVITWMFVILFGGFLFYLYFDAWTTNSKYAWDKIPLFRTRVILWALVSGIGLVLLAIGGSRLFAMKTGSGAEEFKRKNLILRSKQ